MSNNPTLIEEFKILRKEVDSRLTILHQLIALASIFWVVLLITGILFLVYFPTQLVNLFLLIIPLIFTGLTFNYQDNQRTLEATARYIEENLKPKLKEIDSEEVLGWEQWFVKHKKNYQFSSSYKLFALLIPFIIPILLLILSPLTGLQLILAIVNLFFLVVIIANFRYKLFRIK
jgi:hypothetical protein